jgi:hypothetical protein
MWLLGSSTPPTIVADVAGLLARFKDGAVARVLAMEFWTRGKAPTFEEFARSCTKAKAEEHRLLTPEYAYLTDLRPQTPSRRQRMEGCAQSQGKVRSHNVGESRSSLSCKGVSTYAGWRLACCMSPPPRRQLGKRAPDVTSVGPGANVRAPRHEAVVAICRIGEPCVEIGHGREEVVRRIA